jgi:hypothetical protein
LGAVSVDDFYGAAMMEVGKCVVAGGDWVEGVYTETLDFVHEVLPVLDLKREETK